MLKLLLQFLLSIFITCAASWARAQSVGGVTSGAKEYCQQTNSGFISVTNFSGNIVDWEVSSDGGANWVSSGITVSVMSYSDLKRTTCFRAVVQNGSFAPDRSTVSCISIVAPSLGGTINGGGLFCDSTGSGILHLVQNVGAVQYWKYSTNDGAVWNRIASKNIDLSYPNSVKNVVYRAFVQNGASCKVDSSNEGRLIVSSSRAGVIEGGGSFCTESGNGVLHLKNAVGSVLYWQYKINDGPIWKQINDTSKEFKYVSIKEDTKYRAVVRIGASCPADTTAAIVFTKAASIAGAISGNNTVCPEVNSGVVRLTGSHGEFFWLKSSDNGATWTRLDEKQKDLNYTNLKQNTFFKAVAKNGACKSDTSATVLVGVLPKTEVHAGRDTVVLEGKSLQLKGSGKGVPEWEPAAGLSSRSVFAPFLTPLQSSLYFLKVRDGNGCINIDTVSIEVASLSKDDIITNVFTPNGDGINDTWVIKNLHLYPSNEVFVYNTYGTLVFYSKGYNNDWAGTCNGRMLAAGAYYYVLKLNDIDKAIMGALEILNK